MSQTWVSSFHKAGSTGLAPIGPPAATPTFSPPGGAYATAQTVTIASTTSLAAIYYTTDGSTPTFPVTGTTQTYAGPLTVATSVTLTAIAIAPGFAISAIAIAAYTVSGLTYQSATLAGFTPGVFYSQSTAGFVGGGIAPLTFTFVSSTGPDTWSVSAAGTISGTPGGVPLVTMAGIPYVTLSGTQYIT